MKQQLTKIKYLEKDITEIKQVISRLKAQRETFKHIQTKNEVTPLMKINRQLYQEEINLQIYRQQLAREIAGYYKIKTLNFKLQ